MEKMKRKRKERQPQFNFKRAIKDVEYCKIEF